MTDRHETTTASATFTWDPTARVAVILYATGTYLRAKDGVELADVLTGWIGSGGEPFAIVADATGLDGTDGEYRGMASDFFRRHRDTVLIAVVKPGPVTQIIAEMFRIGTGVELRVFATEPAARSWLRGKGIAA